MPSGLRTFDLRDDWTDILAAIDQDGGVIVQNFIPGELRDRLIAELSPHAGAQAAGTPGSAAKQAFCGVQTKRFSGLAAKAPAFAEVIDHDLLHEWAGRAFKADYWINTGHAMVVGPGSSAQHLHRDCGNWPLSALWDKQGPEVTISIMLALTDFTADNGATCVVPGSHLWDDYRATAKPDQVVQAVMPAGSALLYTGRVIHGAGANVTSGEWRFGVHLSFVLGQMTPEEALPFTTPWELARNFSPRVQHMLGYASHRTFDPGWPILWTADYRDVRESLTPPPDPGYISAGERLLPRVSH